MLTQRLTPCLWFDKEAEDAANFYVGIFENSRITSITRYPSAGQEIHGQQAGSVMTVAYEIDGHTFTALNGGPLFKFNEAVSFQVNCESQEEVDRFWSVLSSDGGSEGPCGWVEDRFGVSWQVVPVRMNELLRSADTVAAQRAMKAMLGMGKLDIAALEKAAAG